MKTVMFAALASLVFFLVAYHSARSIAEEQWDPSVLPIAPKPFKGHAGLRTSDSQLDFPAEVKAAKGAPNILLIMPDNVGFGASTAGYQRPARRSRSTFAPTGAKKA